MVAKFRYHSEKLCIAKFRRDCEIFAMHSENPALFYIASASFQPLFLQFFLTFLHPSLMKSLRIQKIRHRYEAKLEIMAGARKTCKITKNKLGTKINGTKWTCTYQLA